MPVTALAAETKAEEAKASFESVGEATGSGTTYYIDGESGDDTNDGTSPEEAWATLTKASNTTFQPGDHILLESTCTWNNQTLRPKGDGADGAPIVIDFYTREDDGTASYTASRRPTINANGSYNDRGVDADQANKRYLSGAVQLTNQEYWEIRNLEVTNSTDLSDETAYMDNDDAQRAGILLLLVGGTAKQYHGLRVTGCYVHDVTSEYYMNTTAAAAGNAQKSSGGIIAHSYLTDPTGATTLTASDDQIVNGFEDLTIDNNIVKRVGTEGIRNSTQYGAEVGSSHDYHQYKVNNNVTFKDNYMEDIAGDAMVIAMVNEGGLVEGNVSKHAASADYGSGHYYAGIWAWACNDTTFQYNEAYGTEFGYSDGEAYDVDQDCDNVVYQYNYSHNNKGGFLLFMQTQRNSVARYNISANDGGQSSGSNATGMSGGGGSYTFYRQSIFDHQMKESGGAEHLPYIYNNTIYVGSGTRTSLLGYQNNGSSAAAGTIAHLENNLVVMADKTDTLGGQENRLTFLTGMSNGGHSHYNLPDNYADYIKNNVLPSRILTEDSACGTTQQGLENAGNILTDDGTAAAGLDDFSADTLASQAEDTLENPESTPVWSDTVARMRERIEMYTPSEDGAGVAKGAQISGAPTEDIMGQSTENRLTDIGAIQVSNEKTTTGYTAANVSVTTKAGSYPSLPDTVKVECVTTTEDGTEVATWTEDHDVVWNFIGADSYAKAGTFTVEGRVDGLDKPIAATVTVTGSIAENPVDDAVLIASEDSTVQRGSADTALQNTVGTATTFTSNDLNNAKNPFGLSFSNNYVLRAKNNTKSGGENYHRRAYVKVKLSDYMGEPSAVQSATLRLYTAGLNCYTATSTENVENFANTSFGLDVYATAANWSADTLTWNNAPSNTDISTNNPDGGADPTYGSNTKPVAHIDLTNQRIVDNKYAVDIDVTDYIRSLTDDEIQAIEDNGGYVSFAIDVVKNDEGNYMTGSGADFFSIEGAAALATKIEDGSATNAGGIENVTPTTYAPQLLLSEAYTTPAVSEVEVEVGQTPELPQTVEVAYSDGTTSTVAVTWNSVPASMLATPGTYAVLGTAEGINQPIVCKVTVKAAAKQVASFKAISGISLEQGATTDGLKAKLPKTVTAVFADGSTQELTVASWDGLDDFDGATAGTYTLTAQFTAVDGVTVPAGVAATVTVTVTEKPVDPGTDPDPEPEDKVHTVTFDDCLQGTDNPSVEVKDGETVAASSVPADPVCEGWEFLGWYEHDGKDWAAAPFDFDKTAITSDLTLYAKWRKTGGQPGGETPTEPTGNTGDNGGKVDTEDKGDADKKGGSDKKDAMPQTGDPATVLGLMAAGGAAISAAGVALNRKRRK